MLNVTYVWEGEVRGKEEVSSTGLITGVICFTEITRLIKYINQYSSRLIFYHTHILSYKVG